MELAPFGIDVVSLQPGGVRSSFGEHSNESTRLPDDSLYWKVEQGLRARAQASQAGAVPAEAFAVPVVEKLLLTPPPRIIRGGANSVRLPLLKRLLPPRVLDAKLSKFFGLDALR
jgi:NAD(P)-dependent dehydrogenase (short-subunit alcohol dehydrogenase family)